MEMSNRRDKLRRVLLEGVAVFALIALVLLVNLPAIQFNMLYPEQPLMYVANQSVNGFDDLLNVYLHPQMLHYTIAFFRPSGHFLLYQLLVPLLGWHNTQAFIMVNLIFLALTGYLMIKIYRLLFPTLYLGGYLAFAIYLMHPALILPRILILHFEFAHIFFLMLGLYYFIKFSQCYFNENHVKNSWLAAALFSFMIATSFKEPALMLGAIFFVYFCLQDLSSNLLLQRTHRNILLLVTVTTMTLAVYLTLPWMQLANPVRRTFDVTSLLSCVRAFFYYVFQIGSLTAKQEQFNAASIFTAVAYPWLVKCILWISTLVMCVSFCLVLSRKTHDDRHYKKSLLFLFISTALFLVLPFGWGMGNPWHFSLSILMISMMMGFGYEYLLSRMLPAYTAAVCGMLALVIGLACFYTDHAGIAKLTAPPTHQLIFTALRNAQDHPPDIKAQLNHDSIIVVEDKWIASAYMMDGAGILPFYHFQLNPDFKSALGMNFLLKMDPNYSGTLFRYAYDMPDLREMAYPFALENMKTIPNQIIYQWLKSSDNIFCLSYDEHGNWHDRSAQFRKNLKQEAARRELNVSHYRDKIATAHTGSLLSVTKLPYADQQLCEYTCDQNKLCGGFNYRDYWMNGKHILKCQFYYEDRAELTTFDATSTAYSKNG